LPGTNVPTSAAAPATGACPSPGKVAIEALHSRLALSFILLTVALDAIGIGLICPVMPDLMRQVTHPDLSGAALWGGVLTAAFAVMQFLFGPIVGNLSDRFGRRPVPFVSLVVMVLDYVVMALAQSVWSLLAARIIIGITAATHSTANAYVADISPPAEWAGTSVWSARHSGSGSLPGPSRPLTLRNSRAQATCPAAQAEDQAHWKL
jgi:DHA1 family tetracycline resistance protein-like MFS transporter